MILINIEKKGLVANICNLNLTRLNHKSFMLTFSTHFPLSQKYGVDLKNHKFKVFPPNIILM